MSARILNDGHLDRVAVNGDSALGLQPANSDALDLRDIGRFTVGFSAYSFFAFLFDYPLFGAVIWYFGAIKGSLVMLTLTLAVDLCSIRLYDWAKKDWLALEFIRSHRIYSGQNIIRRAVRWILTRTPLVVQVVFLSLKFNAFIVTALLREQRSSFNGLSRRDWGIFALSFLTAQLYWSICIAAGVEGLSWVAAEH